MKTQTPTKQTARRALFAAAFCAAALPSLAATAIYWKGGSGGTESDPKDVYDKNNWTTSSTYSGASIGSNPSESNNMNFQVDSLTYLTNANPNAATAQICEIFAFHKGDYLLAGFFKTKGAVRIGRTSGMQASVTVNGGSVNCAGEMSVGYDGNGTLAVNDGAEVTVSGAAYVSHNSAASTGAVYVNGGSLSFAANFIVGSKGTGTVTVDDGSVAYANDAYIGHNAGAAGAMTVNGGSVTSTGSEKILYVGNNGNGTLTLNNGTVETYMVRNGYGKASDGASGTINLNGGTLRTRRIYTSSNGSGTINFNGGTLKAHSADPNAGGLITSATTVNVLTGGGTIDSGNRAITVGAAIHGAGAMRFKGGSSITLSGASDYTGGTIINLGTKIVTSNATAKDTILGNLVIDGRDLADAATGIAVFEYNSALTADDLAHVTLVNCGTGLEAKIDGNSIVVDFKLPAWELAADATWSSLVAEYGAPAADAVVRIVSSGRYTLTIDTDVAVSQIGFSGTNPDVVVNTGATVATDAISFSGSGTNYLKNDGVIVLNGAGTTTLPFHNDSRGAYYVNNGGRLNVSRVTQGTLAPGFVPEGTNQFVCVGSGAIYDVSGVAYNTASVRLAEGATIANNVTSVTTGSKQTPQLILDGDATANVYRSFGLIGTSHTETRLDLGEHTLTVTGGGNTFSFFLDNTTVSGTGKVFVEEGKLATYRNTHGDSWSLEIGPSGQLVVGDQPAGNTLTVGDFVNNGTDSSVAGALVVKGTLTPGNDIKRLTLADGSTVKASASKVQTVTTAFSASGTVYIDAADIVSAIGEGDVPVLTVPKESATSAATWRVINAGSTNAIWKWRTDAGGTTKTLYVGKPAGVTVIFY